MVTNINKASKLIEESLGVMKKEAEKIGGKYELKEMVVNADEKQMAYDQLAQFVSVDSANKGGELEEDNDEDMGIDPQID